MFVLAKKRAKKTKRYFVVDFDDYCDSTMADTIGPLTQLKEQYPLLKVTLFTIPSRTSPQTIAAAEALGDWVALAPHGYFHTRGECLAWSDEEAYKKIKAARDMGLTAPIFRAPGWLLDGDTYIACQKLDISVASHNLFRIPQTGVPEYVYNLVQGRSKGVRPIHGHVSPVSGNFIRDMIKDGRLSFPVKADFKFCHEATVILEPKYYEQPPVEVSLPKSN
jgi:hypothetical protein